jgi:hypothetical protein
MRSAAEEIDNASDRYDAGDTGSVKEAQKRAKLRAARHLNGLKQIMGSADGRLWMWDFLTATGLFQGDFNGNSKDYFNLGRRNVGLPVFAMLQRECMDEYTLMVKENSNV